VSIQLPRLPQTQPPWPEFQAWWEEVVTVIERHEEEQQTAFEALEAAVAAIQAAQDAADAANAAAASAQTAATNAQTAADDTAEAGALANSYVSGATITATDVGAHVTVAISAHTRKYPQPDGSTVDVAVSGGSVTGLIYSTTYFIYYDDPARAGGAVTYAATTSDTTAAQIGDRHVVGQVTTPAALAAPSGGSAIRPPGSNGFPYP
jgi:hypothetical protein